MKQQEVKESEVEVLNIADDAEDTPEEDDDIVIPPVEEPATPIKEETPEPTPEPEESSPEVIETEPSQPKPVEGETPREKALRLEIVRLRTEKREAATGKVFNKAEVPQVPVNERLKKLHETYSETEIKNMEEAIDVLAEAKGYVKKEHTYADVANSTLESFIEEHPEYKPVNDKDDIRWNRFNSILTSGIYNLSGKTPSQLKSIFTKVHADVQDELGEPEVATTTRKTAAAQQKVKSVSHSGGSKPVIKPEVKQIDPTLRSHFKGFDDEDLI